MFVVTLKSEDKNSQSFPVLAFCHYVPTCEIHDAHVGDGHTECHAGQLAVQLGDHLAHGLGSAGGGGDDVLRGRAAVTPRLEGG